MSHPYSPPPAGDEPQPERRPDHPATDHPTSDYPATDYPATDYGQQQYAPHSYGSQPYGQPPSDAQAHDLQPYAQPYAQPYGAPAPEHPQGTIILILGILGFFTLVTAPFAWYLGSKATREIKASGIAYSNETQITIGRILGIVFTLLAVLGFVLGGIALLAIFGLAASSS